jgi:hypothetical protein
MRRRLQPCQRQFCSLAADFIDRVCPALMASVWPLMAVSDQGSPSSSFVGSFLLSCDGVV